MISPIKILTWLASPIGILTACCLVAGSLLAFKRAPRFRRLILTLGISQLLIFAWPPVAVSISQGLENKARQLQAQNTGGPYAAILLLGGGITPATPDNQTPANANEAFDRIVYAAQLYHQAIAPLIIVSGGSGLRSRYPEAQTEAAAMRKALILMGIPKAAFVVEDQSLTTRQNIALTAELLKAQNMSGKIAMVTSATHMPRAIHDAKKTGLDVDAYPTDWSLPLSYRSFLMHWLPNAQSLKESELSIKEWIATITNY